MNGINGIVRLRAFSKALFEKDYRADIEAFLAELPARWVTEVLVIQLMDGSATLALVPPKAYGEAHTLQYHWGDFRPESAKPWDHPDAPPGWKVYLSLPLLLLKLEEHLMREARVREDQLKDLQAVMETLRELRT